ncbi:hypothetical protein MBM_01514 [Drepanopeziza brunnea f. sp. 'multigermtubi' MB_m1]|uniref:Uncharacterized protein n=1 Tax=Marssonina brunnea f. sp. multigermtubi (strain MB_m1) TaxID=1072389 RepID=K1X6V3_MARBU|nr:uncharacterized protein MBM_01514 [Drepanopeziza brunnea f. sp. 'multigermtubi' MB_m1]EKD20832.1 hypothetical protein MBM_01514 [Drepanopeziza brunnea f. sp. 'multigermtubi' MB_m1]
MTLMESESEAIVTSLNLASSSAYHAIISAPYHYRRYYMRNPRATNVLRAFYPRLGLTANSRTSAGGRHFCTSGENMDSRDRQRKGYGLPEALERRGPNEFEDILMEGADHRVADPLDVDGSTPAPAPPAGPSKKRLASPSSFHDSKRKRKRQKRIKTEENVNWSQSRAIPTDIVSADKIRVRLPAATLENSEYKRQKGIKTEEENVNWGRSRAIPTDLVSADEIRVQLPAAAVYQQRRQQQRDVWVAIAGAFAAARAQLHGEDLELFEALFERPVAGMSPNEQIDRWIRGTHERWG